MEEFGSAERDRLFSTYGQRFAAGQVIFREGEPATDAYLLHEGRVRSIKRVRAVERSLSVLGPGDLFGESALVTGAPRWSTAIALSEVAALALNQATFQTLLERHSSVAGRVIQQLIKRVRDAEDQIEIMMLRDTQSKIVKALLKLAQQGAQEGKSGALVPVSPMELSTRVGLDVDTVKRGVKKLRDSQYLRVVDEKIEIPDLDSLRRLFALLGVKDEIEGAHPAHVAFGRGGQ